MPPAARVGDAHACPTGSHVGGPVSAPGSATVNIGGQPAARAGDRAECAGPSDLIVQGSPTVFIDGRPAARVGDRCGHSGVIVTGCATVIIGDQAGGGGAAQPPGSEKGGRRRRPPVGGGTSPVPGGPPGAGGLEKAVPKPPAQAPPTSKTGKETSPSTDPAKDAATGETQGDSEKGPTLFGSPATMELFRAVARLAQKMIPGLANRVPPVDPQVMQATVAELREAIARKDVQAMNEISARLTAMMQPPAPAASGGGPSAPASGSSTSPWTLPGQS